MENGRQRIQVPVAICTQPHAETIRLLRGARLITDLESRMIGSEERRRRTTRDVKELEQLSVKFGLASRAMSLVAVVERAGDHLGEIPQTQVIPVGMPQDMAFGAYFEGAGSTTLFDSVCKYEPGAMANTSLASLFSRSRQAPRASKAKQQELFKSAQLDLVISEEELLSFARELEADLARYPYRHPGR